VSVADAVVYCADASFVIGVLWFIAQWRFVNVRRDECDAWERVEMAKIEDERAKNQTHAVGFCAPSADDESEDDA